MIRPVDESRVHALVMTFADALQETEFAFSSEDLMTAVFRFARHVSHSVLSSPHSPFLRDFIKQQATTLLFDLQSAKVAPIDGGLEPPNQTIGDEVV